MKKTFRHLLPICLRYVLMCWLLAFSHARLSAQCAPDTLAPVIACPPNQTLLASPGQCAVPVTLGEATAGDNCSGSISITASMSSGDLFPTGVTTVLYTVTDAAGNTTSCQMTVTVTGNIPRPVCDRWVTLPMDPSGTTTVYPEDILQYGPYDCTQTGVSPDYGLSIPVPSLSFTGTGTHEVYGAVITENGFWEKCWSFVSIVGTSNASCTPDVTPPEIQCRPYYIVYASGPGCQTVIELDEPFVSDNCGAVSWSSNAPPGNLFSQGTHTITYTATDDSGHTSTCASTLRFDYVEPILPVCHPLTVTMDQSGTATVYPVDVLAGGPYDCTTPGISLEFGIEAELLPFLTFTQPGVYYAQVYIPNFNQVIHGCQAVITVQPLSPGCNPDITPPIAVCDPSITVESNTQGPGIARIQANILDDGSTDNCTAQGDLMFRITDIAGTTPPASTYLDVPGIVTAQEVSLWVGDGAGNWNQCILLVYTTPPQCTPDVSAPLLTAPPDMTFSSAAFDALDIDFSNLPAEFPAVYAAFGTATTWDNCNDGNSLLSESFVIHPDKVIRSFFASDFTGNVSEALQTITIRNTFTGHIPGWMYPGDPLDTMSYTGENISTAYWDQVFGSACQGQYPRIERNWGLIDWLFTPQNGDPAILPLLDLDNDGVAGDPYDIIALGDSIWLYQNNAPVQPLIKRAAVYEYKQQILNSYPITGTIFLDTLQNCALDSGEPTMEGWKVKGIGQPSNSLSIAIADGNGAFTLQVCPGDTSVEVSLDVPINYAGSCPSVYVFDVLTTGGSVQHIPVHLNSDCALLGVDIATPYLRPCFTSHYSVSYYNLSNQPISGTYVDVALDSFIQMTSSSLPGVLLNGNTYRFQTGELAPGETGQFSINFLLACNTPTGLSHCTEAFIYPTAICPTDEFWSGAELRVSGRCDGDSVRLEITNIGSSAMVSQLDYVVTEDLIMARMMPYQLGVGGSTAFAVASNGATWRMETDQEPGYPWGGLAAATVEGCGGLNTPGLVNVFPMDDPNPFTATDCTQNVSSFDPNDKQGFPQGYGDEHLIKPNTDLEYLIRFQNTGTDTAFTVVILDTLSQYLDARTVRSGASSHNYDFDLLEGNVLRFRFDNILLPDSNDNEVASHGFVQFRVQQQPDNPLGTVIPNRAAIYFDFNEPVITNATFHTVGEQFITVATNDPANDLGPLRVYPNPAAETVFFELPEAQQGRQFVLSDGTGKRLKASSFSEKVFRFERGALPAGVYFFQINAENGTTVSGKIILK
ncbi:MAG: HYR domain-containing protein [Saprospiraceae bacterium]|nr:HYR domain-containing protein [Saprospiraceae bacterium]